MISVVAHIIILPVAAHFGAFDKIKKEFGTSRVVMVTVPPDEAKKPPAKKAEKAHKTQSSTKKAPSASPKATNASKSSNLPQPKVVAASGAGTGDGGGATVDPNGTGKAGQLPTAPATSGNGGNPTAPPDKPVEPPTNPPTTTPKPEPPKPTPPVETPKPEPPKPAEPKPKKFVQVETITAPEPQIPDDLRGEPFEKTLVVEADVDTDGKPTDVKVAESTGTKELDDIGLDTARRYRFKPATLDDTPVPGHVRFRIIFKVE